MMAKLGNALGHGRTPRERSSFFFSRRYVAIMTRMMFGSSRKSTRTAAAALLSQKVRVYLFQGENKCLKHTYRASAQVA